LTGWGWNLYGLSPESRNLEKIFSEKGKEISGLDEAEKINDVVVFHAGTKVKYINDVGQKQESEYLTSGGRVLGVCGLGETIKDSINYTYQAVSKISFEGMHYRKDIIHLLKLKSNKVSKRVEKPTVDDWF
jgi:phosphoribosylamine-glycine ligase